MLHNADLALLEGDSLAVLGLHGSERLFRLAGAGKESDLSSLPAEGSDAVRDAVAYFDGADQLYRSGGLGLAPAVR
jgi:hypothetical protein